MAAPLIDVGDGTLVAAPVAQPSSPPPAPAPPPPVLAPAPPAPIVRPGTALIESEPGVLIAAPPAAGLPPAPAPAPLPAPGPTTSAPLPPRRIIPPGQAFIDTSDIFEPPALIPAPPKSGEEAAPPAEPGDVGTGDDWADIAASLYGYSPDLGGLPEWELVDPFALTFEAADNLPLKGGGAVRAVAQACADYGVDALAAIANALNEGAGGGIGDGGTSYGPFQLHDGGALPANLSGRGKFNKTVNAWAWTENGIRYAIRAMVNGTPSARGLVGHRAVYAIVYGFERPADREGAYKTRAATYDHLIALDKDWPAYAAARFAGPQNVAAVDPGLGNAPTTTPAGSGGTAKRPAGVQTAWRDLMDFYAVTVPRRHKQVVDFDETLLGVFK